MSFQRFVALHKIEDEMTRKTAIYSAFILLCACDVDPVADAPTDRAGATPASLPDLSELALPVAPSAPAAVPLLTSTPVESVADLPGDYYRPFSLPGQVSLLSLASVEPGSDGDYELFRSCGVPVCVPESGRYHAVPQNPAVGFAFVQLSAGGVAAPDTYILDAAWRSDDGAIAALQMRRLLPGDIVGAPFLMFRIPVGDGDAMPEPAALPAPVAAIDDFPGVYVRALVPYGEVGALTFDEPAWTDGTAVGTYRAAQPYCLPWCLPETGTYSMRLDSQVLGSGELTLIPDANPAHTRNYRIDAAWRSWATGEITALQMRTRYAAGITSPPFLMYRQWWTADDPVAQVANELTEAELVRDAELEPDVAAAIVARRASDGLFSDAVAVARAADSSADAAIDTALCEYYRGLQEYYAIRALQCAYSVCYPLSPWYGYWANYYMELADAVCDDA